VHDTTNHDWFTIIKLIDSQNNLNDALYRWWFKDETIKEFDDCVETTDVRCNPSCPPVDATYLPDDPDDPVLHPSDPTTTTTTDTDDITSF